MAPKIDQIKCRTVHFRYISGTIGIFINDEITPRLITSFADSRGDFTNLKSTLVWTEDDFLYNFISEYDAVIELPGWPINNPDSTPIQQAFAIAPNYLEVYPGGSYLSIEEASHEFTFDITYGYFIGPALNRTITSKEFIVQHNFKQAPPYYWLLVSGDGSFIAGFKNFTPDGNNSLGYNSKSKTWEGHYLDSIDQKLTTYSEADLATPLLYVEFGGGLVRISKTGGTYKVVINKNGIETTAILFNSSYQYITRGLGSLQNRTTSQNNVSSLGRFIDWGNQTVTLVIGAGGRFTLTTSTAPITKYYFSQFWAFMVTPPIVADGGKYYLLLSDGNDTLVMTNSIPFITP